MSLEILQFCVVKQIFYLIEHCKWYLWNLDENIQIGCKPRTMVPDHFYHDNR